MVANWPLNCVLGLETKDFSSSSSKKIISVSCPFSCQSHGIIYVVDASAAGRERLEEARQILYDTISDERTRCKPLLVLCNKCDHRDHLTPIAMLQELDLQRALVEVKGDDHMPAVRLVRHGGLNSEGGRKEERSVYSVQISFLVLVSGR